MNLYVHPRPIYLARCGETIYTKEGRVGGDPILSEDGTLFGKLLG